MVASHFLSRDFSREQPQLPGWPIHRGFIAMSGVEDVGRALCVRVRASEDPTHAYKNA